LIFGLLTLKNSRIKNIYIPDLESKSILLRKNSGILKKNSFSDLTALNMPNSENSKNGSLKRSIRLRMEEVMKKL